MFTAERWELSVNILKDRCSFVEVYYIAFPRFHAQRYSGWASYENLEQDYKDRLDKALAAAKEVAHRFNADGRHDATKDEIHKAFNRMQVC